MKALMSRIRTIKRSRGAILALAAFVLVVFLGMVALAVDLGVVALTNGQLKTVADAASLAGAIQLVTNNRSQAGYVPTAEAASAVQHAIAIGQANNTLNSAAVVLSRDVEVGHKQTYTGTPPNAVAYYDPTDATWQTVIDPTTNSVRVTASRDGGHVGVIPAFFSRIWGSTGLAASVISTATAEVYQISGYNPGAGTGDFLPFAMDQTSQQTLLSAGSVSLYPYATGSPGNYGTVNFGVTANSTQVLGQQIDNGITAAQMAAAPNGGNFDFTSHTYDFTGDTGISAGIKDNLTSIIGEPRLILIYSSVSNPGNNALYKIVGVQAIQITAVDFKGNNKIVTVAPTVSRDPGGIPGPPSSWTQGGMLRLHLSR